MKTIPTQLMEIRKSLKMSQAAFGKIIGVTGAAINNYEKNRRKINAEDFQAIVIYKNKATKKLTEANTN